MKKIVYFVLLSLIVLGMSSCDLVLKKDKKDKNKKQHERFHDRKW